MVMCFFITSSYVSHFQPMGCYPCPPYIKTLLDIPSHFLCTPFGDNIILYYMLVFGLFEHFL